MERTPKSVRRRTYQTTRPEFIPNTEQSKQSSQKSETTTPQPALESIPSTMVDTLD